MLKLRMEGIPIPSLLGWKSVWGSMLPGGRFSDNAMLRWEYNSEYQVYHIFWEGMDHAAWQLKGTNPDWRPIAEYQDYIRQFDEHQTMVDPEMDLDEIALAQELYAKLEGGS